MKKNIISLFCIVGLCGNLYAENLRTALETSALLINFSEMVQNAPRVTPQANANKYLKRAKVIADRMDELKSTGERKGNPLAKKFYANIIKAQKSGLSLSSINDAIFGNKIMSPESRKIKYQALENNVKAIEKLGLNTPDNLSRMSEGKSPIITKGNPKYIGEPIEVDHRVPKSVSPEYENTIENLSMLPKSVNRKKSANMDKRDTSFKAQLDKAHAQNKRLKMQRRLNAGLGLWLMVSEANPTYQAMNNLLNNPNSNTALEFGEHAGFAVSGLGMAISGLPRTISFAKFGGRMGVAGFILAEGCMITNWLNDGISNRAFYSGQAQLLSGLAGVWAGAWAGAKIGAFLGAWVGGMVGGMVTIEVGGAGAPPGAGIGGVIGGFFGAIAGAFGASWVSEQTVNYIYDKLDEKAKREVESFIYQQYGV